MKLQGNLNDPAEVKDLKGGKSNEAFKILCVNFDLSHFHNSLAGSGLRANRAGGHPDRGGHAMNHMSVRGE
jgi:hypothetical protein